MVSPHFTIQPARSQVTPTKETKWPLSRWRRSGWPPRPRRPPRRASGMRYLASRAPRRRGTARQPRLRAMSRRRARCWCWRRRWRREGRRLLGCARRLSPCPRRRARRRRRPDPRRDPTPLRGRSWSSHSPTFACACGLFDARWLSRSPSAVSNARGGQTRGRRGGWGRQHTARGCRVVGAANGRHGAAGGATAGALSRAPQRQTARNSRRSHRALRVFVCAVAHSSLSLAVFLSVGSVSLFSVSFSCPSPTPRGFRICIRNFSFSLPYRSLSLFMLISPLPLSTDGGRAGWPG